MCYINADGFIADPYKNFIHISRYARWLEEKGRRESWVETVDRYMSFMINHLVENHKYKANNPIFKQMREAILNHKVMPSMRAVMSAGPSLERDHISVYNCSFISVDSFRAFDEAMYVLMNGTGVGFSVEQKYIANLPVIAEEFHITATTIVVEDSKMGWAKAFKELIALLSQGQIPQWDMSKVRPAGARLKTFGGRASGPDPLNDLFRFTCKTFKNARGRRLKSLEAHDIMCKVGEVVVVGGVRRSALISLSNLDDFEMAKAKSGQWWETEPQRQLANNSAVYNSKPNTAQFLREWRNLYESKSGERGIINMDGIKKHVDSFGRRDATKVAGLNPCAEIILRQNEFCVKGDTKLITKNHGIDDIENLLGKNIEIWNGNTWSSVVVRKTREKQKLVRVNLSDGSFLDCTPDHKFSVNTRFQKTWNKIEAGELYLYSKYATRAEPYLPIINDKKQILNDAYSVGFAVGDGCVYRNKVLIDLYGEKDQTCPGIGKRGKITTKKNYNVSHQRVSTLLDPVQIASLKTNPDEMSKLTQYSRNSFLEFLAGLADADGSNASSGIRIYISNEDRARALQLVCSYNGIKSSVNLSQKKGVKTNFGPRTQDLWYLQITECHDIPCHKLTTGNGRPAKFKGKYQTIRSVEKLSGNHDVYCFTENERHMGVFNNVLTHQCNLTEVVIESADTKENLLEKVELATILGTWQATLTDFKYIRKVWKTNCEEERLLGVSLTGIFGNTLTSTNGTELASLLDDLRLHAVDINKKEAEKVGINASVAITCVKPSGTVSQLTGVSSGIHPWHAPYYIRTVRADNNDPLTIFLKSAGIPFEPCVSKPETTTIFSFPIKAPDNAIVNNSITAIEHLEIWKTYRTHWTEHNPSITVYVKEDEWLDVGAWVFRNFDSVGGISFLPATDHIYKQAPYQEISKEKYDEAVASMPKDIKWADLSLYEKEDTTTGTQELSCVAGVCEIVDISARKPNGLNATQQIISFGPATNSDPLSL